MKSQIPLSFPVQSSYAAHDFMTLPCNQDAMEWIDKFPDWPYPVVIVYGEKGCGKTHLLNFWNSQNGDAGDIIDDADLMFGDALSEQKLFHSINQAKEKKTYLLMSMSKNIGQQIVNLPDLASRLRAAPTVEIHAPTEMDLQALMVKLFHDRQLKIAPDVISYILPRIERTFATVHKLIANIDEVALAEKRSVTVPLVRKILVEPKLI